MPEEQDVNTALYQLAGRCYLDRQYELAIKCLLAVLQNDPVPDVFAQCSLDLARIYTEYTDDVKKAQQTLLQLVRLCRGSC
jgi:tetratricopeptide (TPR) repeat protein